MTDDKFLATVEMYDAKLNRWKTVDKAMREGMQIRRKTFVEGLVGCEFQLNGCEVEYTGIWYIRFW